MFSANNKVSLRQIQFLLVLDIFGNGVTVLPRIISEQAGQDGWISIILATLGAVTAVYLSCSIAGRFPQNSFHDYVSELISRPLAAVVCLAFVFKIIAALALELRFFVEIIREFMLMNTPAFVLSASMLILGSYAASKGFEARARLAEVLVIIIFIPFALMFVLAAFDVDFSNLLPVMVTAPRELLRGGGRAFFSFSGIEFLLLSYSYMNRPKSARKSAVSVTLLLGFMMLCVSLITVARFGVTDVRRQLWPVIEMMDSIDLPGSFIERQSALIMSFWIVSVFAAVSAKMFFSSLILRDTIKRGKQVNYVLLLLPAVFLLSLLPENIAQAYSYMDRLNYTFGLFFMLILPVLLLAAAKIRKRGESA